MIVAFSLNSSLDGKKKNDGFSERNLRDPFLNSSSEVCSSSYSKFHTFMRSPVQIAREAAVLSFRAERGHFKSVYMQGIFTVTF